jgi:hypothetical protein
MRAAYLEITMMPVEKFRKMIPLHLSQRCGNRKSLTEAVHSAVVRLQNLHQKSLVILAAIHFLAHAK